jgi:hypothetical protein
MCAKKKKSKKNPLTTSRLDIKQTKFGFKEFYGLKPFIKLVLLSDLIAKLILNV